LSRMLDGISKTTYGMKKMASATLGWFPVRCRSSCKPIVSALEILTLVTVSQCDVVTGGTYRSRKAAT
jgi:hypothetical protein